MSYLLDTHTLIWPIQEVDKIPAGTRAIIQDTRNTVYVSVVTIWEFSIKFSLGKVSSEGLKPDDLPSLTERNQFIILPLRPEEAAGGHQLPWIANHRDPFDRILIWQAITNDLVLISRDGQLKGYEKYGLQLIW